VTSRASCLPVGPQRASPHVFVTDCSPAGPPAERWLQPGQDGQTALVRPNQQPLQPPSGSRVNGGVGTARLPGQVTRIPKDGRTWIKKEKFAGCGGRQVGRSAGERLSACLPSTCRYIQRLCTATVHCRAGVGQNSGLHRPASAISGCVDDKQTSLAHLLIGLPTDWWWEGERQAARVFTAVAEPRQLHIVVDCRSRLAVEKHWHNC